MQNNLRRFMRKYTKLLSLFLVLVFIFSLMQSPMAMATGTEDGDEEQAEQRSAPPDSGGGDEGTGGGNDNAGGGSEGGEGSDTTNPPANPDGGGNPPVDQGSGVDGTGSDPTNPSSGTGESGSGDDPTTPTSPVNPGSIIGGGGDGSGTGDDLPAIRGDAALGATRATAPYTVSNSANYAMRDTSFISNHYYYCVTGERLSDFGSLACHNLKVTATGNTFPVFCIQPNLPASEQGYDDPDPAYPWTSFSSEVQTLIVKALYWGYPSYNDSATGDNTANHAATQAMVFDIVCGFVVNQSGTIKNVSKQAGGVTTYGFCDNNYGLGNRAAIRGAYDRLLQRMNTATGTTGVPSFANAGGSSASNVLKLTYNRTSGLFEGTFSDSNSFAFHYSFAYNSNGITVTQSGNSVTITATPEAVRTLGLLNGSYSLPTETSSVQNVSIDTSKVEIYTAAPGSMAVGRVQRMMRYIGAKPNSSPTTAYLAIGVDQIYDPIIIQLTKLTQDGNTNGPSRAGAQYTIKCYEGLYTSSTLPASPDYTWVFQTDANGLVDFGDPSYFVSGDALIVQGGNAVVPDDCTITVQETRASTGYNLDGTASVGSITAPVSEPLLFQVSGDVFTVIRGSNSLTADSITIYEQVTRGGLKIQKHLKDHTGTEVAYAIGTAKLGPATFTIKNKNSYPIKLNDGTEIAAGGTWDVTTGNDGTFTSPADYLPYGSYSITEKTAPEGTIRDTASYDFAITTEGGFHTHTAVNQVIEGSITVQKRDKDTGTASPQGGASLAGAQFTVTNVSGAPILYNGTVVANNGTVCTITTNASGVATVSNLPVGNYQITETAASPGYKVNSTPISASITPSATAASVTCDEEIIRGALKIIKHLSDHTGTEVAYAIGSAELGPITFTLKNKNSLPITLGDGTVIAAGGTWEITTDANGAYSSAANYLPYGNYSITEKTAPDGTTRDTGTYDFTVSVDGGSFTHTAVNQVIEGSVHVFKKDAETGEATPQGDGTLEGAQFTVKNVSGRPVLYNGSVIPNNGTVCVVTTNAAGEATITNLIVGVYEITETSPPLGYTLADTTYSVTITP